MNLPSSTGPLTLARTLTPNLTSASWCVPSNLVIDVDVVQFINGLGAGGQCKLIL